MKNRIIVVFLLQFFAVTADAQVKFFVEAAANYSFIPTEIKKEQDSYQVPGLWGYSVIYPDHRLSAQYGGKIGANLLLGIQKALSKNINLESGVGISIISFEKKVALSYEENIDYGVGGTVGQPGQPFGILYGTSPWLNHEEGKLNDLTTTDTNIGKTGLLYLTLPLNINYMLVNDRLAVGGGLSVSFLLGSRQLKEELIVERVQQPGGVSDSTSLGLHRIQTKEVADKSNRGLNTMNWGGQITVQYRVYKKTWAIVGFQQGFSPIYSKEEGNDWAAKLRTVSLGLRYYL